MNGIVHRVVCITILITALAMGIAPMPSLADEPVILQLSKAFRQAIERVRPAVVSISAERASMTVEEQLKEWEKENSNMPDLFKQMFPDSPDFKNQMIPKRDWQGSGVIISASGEILTNNHVVREADSLTIILDDGREMGAKIVATDPATDLALMQLDGEGPFPYAELGDSTQVQVGDWVLAIGNPFGLNQSVSEGIISAVGRSTSKVMVGAEMGIEIADYLQTTAAINPGNSGGPLVNLNGEVIGVNNSIQTAGVPANLGIGFAIPTAIAKVVIQNLEQYGTVKRGAIGILLENDPEIISPLYTKYGLTYGAVVQKVYPGLPAEKAGILEGDIILTINGQRIRDYGHLIYVVSMLPIDTELQVILLRNGEEMEKSLVLVERSVVKELARSTFDAEHGTSAAETVPEVTAATVVGLGVNVVTLTPELAKEKGYAEDLKGVLITSIKPGSAAQRYDIKEGDVIAEVNNKTIETLEAFEQAMNEATVAMKNKAYQGRTVMLYLYRAGSRFHPKYLAPTIEPRL
ncbi:MAG: trypsin-like peptidase domain-containing protein [bacterium]|jgi:Do/DeqQ family serine protease|nr:trypsin-like peptidase domain-containing protein [bacterium]